MARSFALADGDGDTLLTLALLVVAIGLSLFNFYVRTPAVVVYPAPLFVFLLTRWGYKRQLKKHRASLTSHAAENSEPGDRG